MARLQIGVIGLGKFGRKFGETMMLYGHDVLGIDHREANVKQAQDLLQGFLVGGVGKKDLGEQVFLADATNKEALEQVGVADLSHVLVSVGDSIAASTMISLYLKELGVPTVWVKAVNEDHEKLLRKVGVDEVVIPEHMAARNVAAKIAMPGFVDNLPFDERLVIKELTIDRWNGKTLRDLDLTNRYNLQVIAVKKRRDRRYKFIPKADDVLKSGDTLVVIGRIGNLDEVAS